MPERTALADSSGWPQRKRTACSRGLACTAASMAACNASMPANGRWRAADSATQGAYSNTSPSAATKSPCAMVLSSSSEGVGWVEVVVMEPV
ncbi:hypothetical protein D3C72_2131990 [compost metagenome]